MPVPTCRLRRNSSSRPCFGYRAKAGNSIHRTHRRRLSDSPTSPSSPPTPSHSTPLLRLCQDPSLISQRRLSLYPGSDHSLSRPTPDNTPIIPIIPRRSPTCHLYPYSPCHLLHCHMPPSSGFTPSLLSDPDSDSDPDLTSQ